MSWEVTPGMYPTPTRWFLLEKGGRGRGGGVRVDFFVSGTLAMPCELDNGQPMSPKDSLSTVRCPYEKMHF